MQPPLSFANLCDTHVASRCNNKEPQQNKVNTWNSFNWYSRKIIQYPNYEEKSCLTQVKLWNVLQVRNLKNFISLSFPFFAFHYSFILIFNFSVLRLLQSYLRPLVTSFLRDLKTPWQSGWRIWQNTVSNSVLGKWTFFMDFIGASKLWVKCCIHQGFLRFHVAHLPLIAQAGK